MTNFALRAAPLATAFLVAIACDDTVDAVMAPADAAPNDASVSATDAPPTTEADSSVTVDAATDGNKLLTTCPFGTEARALIAEAIARTFADAKYVSMESHPAAPPFNGRVAHALSLVGTNNALLSGFTPIEPCNATNAQVYDAYCDPVEAYSPGEFGEKFGRCSRSECKANGDYWVDTYFTLRPQLASTPRHAISYAFDAIEGSPLVGRAGTVTWAENPVELWKRVPGTDGSLAMTADSTRAVSIALDAGPTVDLAATTHTEVRKKANEETERLLVEMSFTNVTTAGILMASVETTDPTEQTISGTLKIGDQVLATAIAVTSDSGLFTALPGLVWQGVCQ